jgi:Na+-transporting methylmalonyl-CoA/oxaloacetate decarboxylase gamma subunit
VNKLTILDRVGRPLLRLCGVAFVVVVIWFLIRIMGAIVAAYDHAASTSSAVPDMSGGLAGVIAAILGSLPIIIPMAIDQITRHRERTDQIRRGEGPPPFGQPSSRQSSPESSVNPHGGPDTP